MEIETIEEIKKLINVIFVNSPKIYLIVVSRPYALKSIFDELSELICFHQGAIFKIIEQDGIFYNSIAFDNGLSAKGFVKQCEEIADIKVELFLTINKRYFLA